MLGRAAVRSGLRVLAIEFGESDIFGTGDGYVDGDDGGRNSGRWSGYGDDRGDDGGSAYGQDADVWADSNGADAEFYDCGDDDSKYDGGESERNLERDVEGGEWIQRKRDIDVYRGSAGNVVDHADDADAYGRGRSVYGDAGQRYGGDIQFCDPRNGRDADAGYTDRDADGDGGGCGLYVDGHGQHFGDSAGGTERQLYVFGGSGRWHV